MSVIPWAFWRWFDRFRRSWDFSDPKGLLRCNDLGEVGLRRRGQLGIVYIELSAVDCGDALNDLALNCL